MIKLSGENDLDATKVQFEIKGGVHMSWEDDEIQIIAECHINDEKTYDPFFDRVKASQEYVC